MNVVTENLRAAIRVRLAQLSGGAWETAVSQAPPDQNHRWQAQATLDSQTDCLTWMIYPK